MEILQGSRREKLLPKSYTKHFDSVKDLQKYVAKFLNGLNNEMFLLFVSFLHECQRLLLSKTLWNSKLKVYGKFCDA